MLLAVISQCVSLRAPSKKGLALLFILAKKIKYLETKLKGEFESWKSEVEKLKFLSATYNLLATSPFYLFKSIITSIKVDEIFVIYARGAYNNDLDYHQFEIEMAMLRKIGKNSILICFSGFYQRAKENGNVEQQLILNVKILCNLSVVNPPTSGTSGHSFPTTGRLKTWFRSTILVLTD